MYLNTKIVNALMTLRAISPERLAAVTGLSSRALTAWLDGTAKDEDSDARLPFDRQLEVIKILGITGEVPRSDVTHAWFLREPAFGSREPTYEPLRTILLYCGGCDVTLLAAEADPFVSLRARTHFALTFDKFRAVLQITSAPFRSLAFSPGSLPNMRWVGEQAPLIVRKDLFLSLTGPGESVPAQLDLERHKALEIAHWKKIGELAAERGMGAPELAHFLIDKVPVKPMLPALSAQLTAAAPAAAKEPIPAAPEPESLFQGAK